MISGGLPSGDITSLARAFGSVWIGTFSGGLARLKKGEVSSVDRAVQRWGVDKRVNDLAVTKTAGGKQRLWIATDRGLWSYDGHRFERADGDSEPGKVHVTSLHVDDTGALWVGSTRTLSRRKKGKWTAWTGDAEVPMLHVHSVATDSNGRVWVGSLKTALWRGPAEEYVKRESEPISIEELEDYYAELDPLPIYSTRA